MKGNWHKLVFPVGIGVGALAFLLYAIIRPGYFSSGGRLGTILFLEVLLAALWDYRAKFLPLLLGVFLWAGMALPMNAVWTSGRWLVLAAGAFAGALICMRDRRFPFSRFHLTALFCVIAAVVSAEASAYPEQAVLKAGSLFLLFCYGSFGVRLAVMGREERFAAGLLIGCELLVYGSSVAYLIFHREIFDNPNSLGAVTGVVGAPVLLWGIFVSQNTPTRRRRTFAFLLALVLLFSSYARAGFAAAAVSCILLCVALRRYSILMKGAVVVVLLAVFTAATVPLPDHPKESLTSVFLYKGRRGDGILGSRKSVWDRTVAVIQEHPWFGSGFGTSHTSNKESEPFQSYESSSRARREHGNSYLEITEWVGFLGDVPFLALLFLIVANVARVFWWLRRTGNVRSLAAPVGAVLAAGLTHAAFEDWLFAVGYYLCIFFWAMAFILPDITPETPDRPVYTLGVAPLPADNLRVVAVSQ